MTLKILLADDHQIFRDGLKALISQSSDLEVVAQANNGREAIDLATEHNPDLAILDVTMKDLNGFEASKWITKKMPKIKIIGLSMHADARIIRDMFLAGASGYLLKNCQFEELTEAINLVMNNQNYLSPNITDVTLDDLQDKALADKFSVHSILTPREREMLQLLAESNSVREIAKLCCISIKTVETHRQHIMEKLKIKTLPGLTKYAIRAGLTSLDEK